MDCILCNAKSLQSCPTLCDSIDGSPPGSPIPGILQARTLEWVAISSSNAWKWKVKVKLLSRVQLLATPWTAAYQAPPSMGFSRQEYWSGLPLPSPMDCIVHEIQSMTEPLSLHLLKSYFFTYLLFLAVSWIFVAVRRLSLAVLSRVYSSLRCSGFSLQWLFLLWNAGSRVLSFSNCSSWDLDHRLSTCDSWALEPRLNNCDAWV